MARPYAKYTVEEDILWVLLRDKCLTICAASLALRLPARASYSSTQKVLLELWQQGRLWRKRVIHKGVSRWFYRASALKGYTTGNRSSG